MVADVALEPALDKRLTDRADACGDRRPSTSTTVSGLTRTPQRVISAMKSYIQRLGEPAFDSGGAEAENLLKGQVQLNR